MATRQLIKHDSLRQTEFYHHVSVSEGGRTIRVAGQAAWDRDRNLLGGDSLEAQTRYTFQNLKTALEAGGATLEDLVMLTFYVVGYEVAHRDILLNVMSEFLAPEHRPPSTLLGVQALAFPELLVEIDGVAVID